MHPEALETCAVVAAGVVSTLSFGAGWWSRGRVERSIREDYRCLFAACQHAVRANGTEQGPREVVHAPRPLPAASPVECARERLAATSESGGSGPGPGVVAGADDEGDDVLELLEREHVVEHVEPELDEALTQERDARAVLDELTAEAIARTPERGGGAKAAQTKPRHVGDDAYVRALTREKEDVDDQRAWFHEPFDQAVDEALTEQRAARAALEEFAAFENEPWTSGEGAQQLEVLHEGEVFELVPERRDAHAGKTKAIDVRALMAAVDELRGDDAGRC